MELMPILFMLDILLHIYLLYTSIFMSHNLFLDTDIRV